MEIKIKGIYKHFKGNLYIVEDIALESETDEKYDWIKNKNFKIYK